jgi:hypothetical protein
MVSRRSCWPWACRSRSRHSPARAAGSCSCGTAALAVPPPPPTITRPLRGTRCSSSSTSGIGGSGSSPDTSRSTLTYPPSFAKSSAMFDDENDELFELTLLFSGSDLRERGLLVTAEESRAPVDSIPGELRRAGLIDRVADRHRPKIPAECEDERGDVRFGERVRPNRAPARGSATQARPSRDRSRGCPSPTAGSPRTSSCRRGPQRSRRSPGARAWGATRGPSRSGPMKGGPCRDRPPPWTT